MTLDWALFAVLLSLASDPVCVTLEGMCESVREAADLHRGTPIGRSTSCQSQVLPQFRQKHGGAVPIRKVVVLGSIAGGQTKSRAAGGELHIIFWGVLRSEVFACSCWSALYLFGRLRFYAPVRKMKKWTHGIERQPQGKDVDSVAICAQLRLCRFLQRPPQPPTIHPKVLCSSPENH